MRLRALWAVPAVPAITSFPSRPPRHRSTRTAAFPGSKTFPCHPAATGRLCPVKLRDLAWADDDHLMITTSTTRMPWLTGTGEAVAAENATDPHSLLASFHASLECFEIAFGCRALGMHLDTFADSP